MSNAKACDIIKVKVVKMSRDSWWYGYLVGKTIDVRCTSDSLVDYRFHSITDGHSGCLILKDDCVVVTTPQTLQERLQQAKATVEEIEKQLVEEAEKEASRPFTQAEYEKVVAEYRASSGRKKYALEDLGWKWGITIANDGVHTDNWLYVSMLPFGVSFKDQESAKQAIAKVGAENLKRAWQYEMSIGL